MSNDSTKEAMRFLLSDADVVLMTRDKLTPAVSYMKAYVEGCFHTRDIYEQARQQDKARIEELTKALAEAVAIIDSQIGRSTSTQAKKFLRRRIDPLRAIITPYTTKPIER